jgi:hypothetical protein
LVVEENLKMEEPRIYITKKMKKKIGIVNEENFQK